MKIAIMQPTFLPWIGYFSMISKVDTFVILDNVQFDKRSWQQRNKIKSFDKFQYLTVPVKSKGLFNQHIREVEINIEEDYISKHKKTITNLYSKSKYFNKFSSNIFNIYNENFKFLIDLNMKFISYFCNYLNINTNIIYSSKLQVEGKKEHLILNICKYLKSDHYLSPIGSKNYIQRNNLFDDNNITLQYFEYNHPIYNQLYNDFIPYLSIIDLVFNEGDRSKNFI